MGVAVHGWGKVLVQSALTLAGGGDICSDVEHLRVGPALFGHVPRRTPVAHTLAGINSNDRNRIAEAMVPLRSGVWDDANITSLGRAPMGGDGRDHPSVVRLARS